jgi:HlyD family secretion protein
MNTSFFQRLGTSIKAHKTRTTILALIIVVAGYFVIHAATKTTPAPTYVLGTVQTGTIVSSVTETGQISTSQSVDLQPQVSGQLTSIDAKVGATVTKGQALFSINATNAARAVQADKESLAAAQLDLRSTQAQNTLTIANDNKTVADDYTTLLSSDLQPQPSDTTTAEYQEPTISGNYTLGKEGTITLTTYDSQGGVSFNTTGLVEATGLTNSTTAQPIGTSGLYVLFPNNIKGGLTWTISIPNTASANYISNENNYQTALQNQTEDADPNGTLAVSIQNKQLSVTQAENSLDNDEETLAEYTVTAPFSGTLATIPVSIGDQVSSGTTLGTVITNQEIATLTLNEVDVSKVQIGDKATLTFDAVNGLSLVGTVATIDPIGTVSSGVVNYTVTVSLDTQDPRIKSGMSVTADIQTGIADNVLEVPSSAIKTSTNGSYVLVPSSTATAATTASTTTSAAEGVSLATAPTETPVTIGLTDGTDTQIVSGLTAGQTIVTKTVAAATAATATKTTASATSLLTGSSTRGAGGYGGAGGAGFSRGG